jgi:hypothetical protein
MTATTDPRPVATQPLEPDRPAMSHREVPEALSGLLLSPRERGRYAGYLGEVFGVGTVAGIAMFGTTVFLSQYMQIARGKSPTESGLLTIPVVVGRFFASTFIGRLVSRTGRYSASSYGTGVGRSSYTRRRSGSSPSPRSRSCARCRSAARAGSTSPVNGRRSPPTITKERPHERRRR